MTRASAAFVAIAAILAPSCGGDGDDSGTVDETVEVVDVVDNDAQCLDADAADEPVVGLIDDAIEATEDHYGTDQEYFEISADLRRVSVIVAVDDRAAAEQGYFCGSAGFSRPEPVGEASGATFGASAVDFDPDAIFDRIRDELSDPAIVDFAIQGAPDDAVLYDAAIASERGGVILVLLGPDGEILATQAD